MKTELRKLMEPFIEGLSSKTDKSLFVGTVIQLIGLCKFQGCKDSEAFDIFRQLLFETEFDETKSQDYLAVYLNQISNRNVREFRLADFEKAMFQLIQDSTREEKSCGARELQMAAGTYQVKSNFDMEYKALADEAEYEEYRTYDMEDDVSDTGFLDESFWNGSQAVNMAENLQAGYGQYSHKEKHIGNTPFLRKETNHEKIPITKDVFSIGKDSSIVDYAITGNTTVSRKHAELIRRGNHFFLCDKGSTNKTYVEGKEIRPEEFVEIHNGTKIKISNEEFTFYQ